MNITIIDRKQSSYCIAVPAQATLVEKTGAQELQNYLMKALGVSLPIIAEETVTDKAIFVGHTAYARAAGICGTAKENWKMQIHEGNLVLTGGLHAEDRGTIYAVYHFLEDLMGVRWWSTAEEDVPNLTALTLPDNLCREGTPKFSYRKIFVNGCYIDDFAFFARTRLNVLDWEEIEGGIRNPSVRKAGGALEMAGPNHVHTFNLYIPPEEYFDQYPEWFAWNEVAGARVSYGQFCFTNEAFFQEMLRKVMENIRQSTERAAADGVEPPCFYSVSLADTNIGFCECENCKKAIEKAGRTGYLLQFVNKLAREVAKIYPEVKLETLVYSVYLDPPKDDTLPEKNVIIRLAHISSDIHHGMHARGNAPYLKRLKIWSDICKRAGCELYIWEYWANFNVSFPCVLAHRAGDAFKTFYDHGVTGMLIENEHMPEDMWEMNQYVLAHLSEDPEADAEALIADFVDRFYKAAAPHVNAYMAAIKTASEKYDLRVHCCGEDMRYNYIDSTLALTGFACLEKAMAAVKGDPVLEYRIRWLQKNLDSAILLKYFDLKHQAERLGQAFCFDREMLRTRILCALEDYKRVTLKRTGNAYSRVANGEIQFYKDLLLEDEEIAPLPEVLGDIKQEDVYQFYFKDNVFNSLVHLNQGRGASVEADPDSVVSRVLKLSYDKQSESMKSRTYVTSRTETPGKKLDIFARQAETDVIPPQYYREDLAQGGYHLYHIGTVHNISDFANSELFIPGLCAVQISGIAVVFPMEACDVYLSMKFTGEVYGGSIRDENAMYLERMILVKKQ